MREYVLVLLVTAAVTFLLTPLVRRVAVATRAIHAPRARDTHTEPTPLLGGLAMYGGLVAWLQRESSASIGPPAPMPGPASAAPSWRGPLGSDVIGLFPAPGARR